MGTYKVGIVGYGWVAGAHLDSFCKMDAYEPVAILSRRELDPADIEARHGAKVKVYNDYDVFLRESGVDVVDICTPHFLHPDQTIAASEAGKHVIIEKPVALTLEDTVRMVKAVEKNKTRTSVCFEVRFISSAKATKSIVDQGLIGDVYYCEADYYHGIGPWYANQQWEVKKKNGGSSLLRAGCHALDVLLYIAGQEVVEVFSYGNTSGNDVYKPYDYDLNTVTLLKFRNGMVGKVSSCTDCSQPYVFNINFVGSEGTVKNDQFFTKKIDGLSGWTKLDVALPDSGDVGNHPYVEQFAHFAECLDQGIDPHNNLRSAAESHRVIFAADASAETGKPVPLSDFQL